MDFEHYTSVLRTGDGAMAWHEKVRPGLLLFLVALTMISEAGAKALEIRYETAYACEGKVLKIECKDGELIKLIRANYGRFSITICNDHGNTDWSVNCMSPKSLRVLHSKCSDRQNCSVEVGSEIYGDPCPGTPKYIEAQYICTLPATTTTTTSRPSPPWLITSQPPMWSTIKPPSGRPPHILPPSKSSISPPEPIPVPATTTVKTSPTTSHFIPKVHTEVIPPHHGEPAEEPPVEMTTLPFTTVTPRIGDPIKVTTSDGLSYTSSMLPSWGRDLNGIPYHCSPTTVRNIYWNWTKVNTTLIQPCPGGTTGFARWRCQAVPNSRQPKWYPPNPDLSECRSVWLTSLEQRILAGRDPLVSITNDLSQVTSSKTLYGGDMMITTKIIQKMTEKMNKDIQTFPDTRQREAIVTEMLMDVAKTGSNLLDSSQHSSWKDLSYKEQMSVATSLLIGLEENAFLLADTVMSKKTVDREFKNILLSVRVLDTKSLSTEKFPSDGLQSEWRVSNDSIELPKGALLENSDGNLVRLVFVAFDRLEEILQWQAESLDASNSQNVSKVLNSKVISASLGKGRHIQLREPVKLTLKHLKTENVSNPTCVFWDYTTNSWSEEGCHVATTLSNLTHTICYCDHLTNFAILMDVHAVYLPIEHEIALQIITYVGCVISIVCLGCAIIIFQMCRNLKSDRTTIHCNLCACLLVAEILFLVSISQTENRILCGMMAGFLQYFFLCAFMWMFFEGFQLYVMLIEVFEAEKSRMKWYYCMAYGLPLVLTLVPAIIYPQGYGTEKHCWLQTDKHFIFSFVGPVIVVISLNAVFLLMAIIKMCKHTRNTVSMKNKEHSRLASTSGKEENALQMKCQAQSTWLKGAVPLLFLLGLTWGFGLLYMHRESVVMAYLFAALNTLQGFFIFLFHCILNEKVRKEYRKFVRRKSWIPNCLSCSKASAGAGSSSGSSGVAKERRTSLYGGSNGNPSGGNNTHSTDNPALTQHPSSNISFKSSSRDSGHGGSEQEDSPRSHMVMTDPGHHLTSNTKDVRHQVLQGGMPDFSDYGMRMEVNVQPRNLPPPQSFHGTAKKKNGNGSKSNYWGHHTYTEIYDAQTPRGLMNEEDPVYEEIDRNDIQISDMSDEDAKRQSDMSRQSSRSYGDHRPLIPYSPAADRTFLDAMTNKHYAKEMNHSNNPNIDSYRRRNLSYRTGLAGDATVRSLAAVLDGETVVCHLEPPDMYPNDTTYVSRTLVLPPYSES